MSGKDYQKLAGVFNQSLTYNESVPELLERMVTMLRQDNPRFDADRFRKAARPSK